MPDVSNLGGGGRWWRRAWGRGRLAPHNEAYLHQSTDDTQTCQPEVLEWSCLAVRVEERVEEQREVRCGRLGTRDQVLRAGGGTTRTARHHVCCGACSEDIAAQGTERRRTVEKQRARVPVRRDALQ